MGSMQVTMVVEGDEVSIGWGMTGDREGPQLFLFFLEAPPAWDVGELTSFMAHGSRKDDLALALDGADQGLPGHAKKQSCSSFQKMC